VMKQNVGKHASNRMFAFKKNKKTRKSRWRIIRRYYTIRTLNFGFYILLQVACCE
jgi:hypothetical protein